MRGLTLFEEWMGVGGKKLEGVGGVGRRRNWDCYIKYNGFKNKFFKKTCLVFAIFDLKYSYLLNLLINPNIHAAVVFLCF